MPSQKIKLKRPVVGLSADSFLVANIFNLSYLRRSSGLPSHSSLRQPLFLGSDRRSPYLSNSVAFYRSGFYAADSFLREVQNRAKLNSRIFKKDFRSLWLESLYQNFCLLNQLRLNSLRFTYPNSAVIRLKFKPAESLLKSLTKKNFFNLSTYYLQYRRANRRFFFFELMSMLRTHANILNSQMYYWVDGGYSSIFFFFGVLGNWALIYPYQLLLRPSPRLDMPIFLRAPISGLAPLLSFGISEVKSRYGRLNKKPQKLFSSSDAKASFLFNDNIEQIVCIFVCLLYVEHYAPLFFLQQFVHKQVCKTSPLSKYKKDLFTTVTALDLLTKPRFLSKVKLKRAVTSHVKLLTAVAFFSDFYSIIKLYFLTRLFSFWFGTALIKKKSPAFFNKMSSFLRLDSASYLKRSASRDFANCESTVKISNAAYFYNLIYRPRFLFLLIIKTLLMRPALFTRRLKFRLQCYFFSYFTQIPAVTLFVSIISAGLLQLFLLLFGNIRFIFFYKLELICNNAVLFILDFIRFLVPVLSFYSLSLKLFLALNTSSRVHDVYLQFFLFFSVIFTLLYVILVAKFITFFFWVFALNLVFSLLSLIFFNVFYRPSRSAYPALLFFNKMFLEQRSTFSYDAVNLLLFILRMKIASFKRYLLIFAFSQLRLFVSFVKLLVLPFNQLSFVFLVCKIWLIKKFGFFVALFKEKRSQSAKYFSILALMQPQTLFYANFHYVLRRLAKIHLFNLFWVFVECVAVLYGILGWWIRAGSKKNNDLRKTTPHSISTRLNLVYYFKLNWLVRYRNGAAAYYNLPLIGNHPFSFSRFLLNFLDILSRRAVIPISLYTDVLQIFSKNGDLMLTNFVSYFDVFGSDYAIRASLNSLLLFSTTRSRHYFFFNTSSFNKVVWLQSLSSFFWRAIRFTFIIILFCPALFFRALRVFFIPFK